ncbi:DUF6273 domain-containing protein [Brevibacillus sp. NRS-1366]|uniref:DUF6273 domain-containing protein n=1 Tax=Brevibacillus sp. NRS-1366 TaxID=3233899 RepID=UPI003D1D7890
MRPFTKTVGMMFVLCLILLNSGAVGNAAGENVRLSTGNTLYFGNYFFSPLPFKSYPIGITDAVHMDVGIYGTPEEIFTFAKVGETYYLRRDGRPGPDYYGLSPVKWRVLSVSDKAALLLAEKGLQRASFPVQQGKLDWAESTVRSWLNGYGPSENASGKDYSAYSLMTFGFSEIERSVIQQTIVRTKISRDTADKIFLLSQEEVRAYFSKNSVDNTQNLPGYMLRDSTKTQGLSFSDDGSINFVDPEDFFSVSVRPALYIDLSKINLTSVPGEPGAFTVAVVPPLVAMPTASTAYVNGASVSFDAYTINQENYFKLRDVAYVLNGTRVQFDAAWDGTIKMISLTRNKAYTPDGSEMKTKGSGNKTPVLNKSKILMDGKEVEFTAYTIDGNNYFKLRELAQVFDFHVGYDSNTKAISIDSRAAYSK